jgi:ABC-type dipeptide/oligopeptide/nickel transport system permease component
MIRFLTGRLLGMAPILLGVTFLVFLILALMPGDPAVVYAGMNASRAEVEVARVALGLDQPLIVRYTSFLGGLATGDFGTSLRTRQPVAGEVLARLPYTLLLAFSALFVAIVIGVPLGVLAATGRGSPLDLVATVTAVVGVSTPNFWLGLMMMLFFSLELGWFPTSGADSWRSLVLPALCLGVAPAAVLARQTRSSMLEILSEDYVRTARAKGATEMQVNVRHALRNAMIPVVTIMGLQLGTLLGGSVVVEMVFAWPGMGRLLIQSINHRDFPMVQACILILSIGFLLANLLVDALYVAFDPRIRY